jgi:hypothetical protein
LTKPFWTFSLIFRVSNDKGLAFENTKVPKVQRVNCIVGIRRPFETIMATISKKASRRKSALSDDEKALAAFKIEGYLEKKSKHGLWQKRYFCTNNRYLNYSKGEGNPVAGSVNLAETESIELGEHKGEFYLSFFDGTEYSLRCDPKAKDPNSQDCYRWVKCLEERKRYYENMDSYHVGERASIKERNEQPDQVGWLKKKSPGFREIWQERYVRLYIDTANLHYYKSSKPGVDKAGSVALDNVQWCRPVDGSAICREFEFLADRRVFRWRAETHEDMSEWVFNIRNALEAATELAKQQQELSKRANTPASVLKFEELKDDKSRKADALAQLDSIFEVCDGQDIAVLDQAVDFAVQDLSCLAEDCAAKPGRAARDDILAFHLAMFHERIEGEIAPFLSDERVQSAENAVLYSLIKLICKYAHGLGDLNARLSQKKRQKSNYLSELGRLSDQLVNGPSGTIRMVQTVCTNAAERQMREGFKGAQMHEDGKYYTHTVIDVWETINMTVKLAEDTKSAALQYMVVEGALNSLLSMLSTLAEDTRNVGVAGERGIEYVCAGMNDCTKHVENLNVLQNDILTLDEVRDRVGPLIDRTMRQLALCGDAGTQVLSRVVLQDLVNTIDTLFSKSWKTGKDQSASTIVATVTDYLNDYSHVLVEYYNFKVAEAIFSRLTIAYVRKLRRQLSPSKADRIRGRYIKIGAVFFEQFRKDCSYFEEGLIDRIQTRSRPPCFLFLDDLKTLLGANSLEIAALTTNIAADIPTGDPLARIAAEQAISLIIKLRSDLKDVPKKDLLASLMGIIDEVVESKEDDALASAGAKRGQAISRMDLYKEAFGVQISIKISEEEAGGAESEYDKDPFAMEGDESTMEWMQHADDDIERKRVQDLAWSTAANRRSTSLPGRAPATSAPERFLDGYLEKRNEKKIWSKRWFELLQLHDASSEDTILLLSWSKNPGEQPLNSIVIDGSSVASIHHATENLVVDESTRLCFLQTDHPTAPPLKLTAKSDNVFILQTAERKLRLRGESALVMLTWANKINELLQSEDSPNGHEEDPHEDSIVEYPSGEQAVPEANSLGAATRNSRAASVRKSVFLKKETLGKAQGFTLSPIHDSTVMEPQGANIFARVPKRPSLPPGDARHAESIDGHEAEKREYGEVEQDSVDVSLRVEVDNVRRGLGDEQKRFTEKARRANSKLRPCCSIA